MEPHVISALLLLRAKEWEECQCLTAHEHLKLPGSFAPQQFLFKADEKPECPKSPSYQGFHGSGTAHQIGSLRIGVPTTLRLKSTRGAALQTVYA